MTVVLRRLRDVFLAAPSAADRPVAAARPVERERALPAAVAVLCGPGDVAAAAAVGVVLAARARGCAVLCRWTGGEPRPAGDGALALPRAAALARRLAARELVATAAGRLVVVDLPAGPREACAVAGGVAATALDVPVVLAIAGPRPSEFDDLLASQDRVLVVPPAGAADGVADLALLDAARGARAAGMLAPAWGVGGRAVAARGLLLPRTVRAATLAALEGRDA